MNAKNKANFINSVANGEIVPCPVCGANNKPDSKFCFSCGTDMTASANGASAFAPVADDAASAGKYVEPASVFADGLPSWDIVPPQVMVRRH